jgi:hypothetical protein
MELKLTTILFTNHEQYNEAHTYTIHKTNTGHSTSMVYLLTSTFLFHLFREQNISERIFQNFYMLEG